MCKNMLHYDHDRSINLQDHRRSKRTNPPAMKNRSNGNNVFKFTLKVKLRYNNKKKEENGKERRKWVEWKDKERKFKKQTKMFLLKVIVDDRFVWLWTIYVVFQRYWRRQALRYHHIFLRSHLFVIKSLCASARCWSCTTGQLSAWALPTMCADALRMHLKTVGSTH